MIISNNPDIEVNILSAVLSDSDYALEEKNQWLDKYLPEVDREHRIFPPCGTDKKDAISGGVRENDFLLDDYTHNLTLWQPPARGIKVLNGINHTRGTWEHDRIRFDKTAEELSYNIISIMHDGVQIRDDKPIERSNDMGTIYKSHVNPSRFSTKETEYFIQEYTDKENSAEAYPGEVIYMGSSDDCISFTNRLNNGEITSSEVKKLWNKNPYVLTHAAVRNIATLDFVNGLPRNAYNGDSEQFNKAIEGIDIEAALPFVRAYTDQWDKANTSETFVPKMAILQFGRGEQNHLKSMLSLADYAKLVGGSPDIQDYELVYVEKLKLPVGSAMENNFLNEQYVRFNADTPRPSNYYGHSLNMGDVIVTSEDSMTMKAFYVDDIGFKELPGFLNDHVKAMIATNLDIRKEHNMIMEIHKSGLDGNRNILSEHNSDRYTYLNAEYLRIFDLADKREIFAQTDKINAIFEFESMYGGESNEDSITYFDHALNRAMLKPDVLMNTATEQLQQLIDATYKAALKDKAENDISTLSEDDKQDIVDHVEFSKDIGLADELTKNEIASYDAIIEERSKGSDKAMPIKEVDSLYSADNTMNERKPFTPTNEQADILNALYSAIVTRMKYPKDEVLQADVAEKLKGYAYELDRLHVPFAVQNAVAGAAEISSNWDRYNGTVLEEVFQKGYRSQTFINKDSNGVVIAGHIGTWYTIGTEIIDGKEFFLMEHEKYGDEAASVIVDTAGVLIIDDVYNGFDDLRYFLENGGELTKVQGAVESNLQNMIDAPSVLDLASDSFYDVLMKLSDGETHDFNINGVAYKVTAVFDEEIDGDNYHTYNISDSTGAVFENLTFSATSTLLNEAALPQTSINRDSHGIEIAGKTGTWHTIDNITIDNQMYFLMENDIDGEKTASIIVNASGSMMLDNVYDAHEGFTDLKYILKNSNTENNFEIEQLESGTFVVRSDSERFGYRAITFESFARPECVNYIAEHSAQPKPSFYIIEDLSTWGNNSGVQSKLERFDTLQDAIGKFYEYRNNAYDYSDGKAKLTMGVSIGNSEFDIVHVRNNENYLVTDFIGSPTINTNKAFLDDMAALEGAIGFEKIRLFRDEQGFRLNEPISKSYKEWNNVFFQGKPVAYYTMNINSDSVPAFHDSFIKAFEEYKAAGIIELKSLGYLRDGKGGVLLQYNGGLHQSMSNNLSVDLNNIENLGIANALKSIDDYCESNNPKLLGFELNSGVYQVVYELNGVRMQRGLIEQAGQLYYNTGTAFEKTLARHNLTREEVQRYNDFRSNLLNLPNFENELQSAILSNNYSLQVDFIREHHGFDNIITSDKYRIIESYSELQGNLQLVKLTDGNNNPLQYAIVTNTSVSFHKDEEIARTEYNNFLQQGNHENEVTHGEENSNSSFPFPQPEYSYYFGSEDNTTEISNLQGYKNMVWEDGEKPVTINGRTVWGIVTTTDPIDTETQQRLNVFPVDSINVENEERRNEPVAKQDKKTDNIVKSDDEKTAKDKVTEQLQQGIRNVMESDQFRDWCKTGGKLYFNNYSFRNAMLTYLQNPESSYVMGYEAWKEFGRLPMKNTGIKIFTPSFAKEYIKGGLYKSIKTNLSEQLQKAPELPYAVYHLGQSKLSFTMQHNGIMGLMVDGRDVQRFSSDEDVRKFIDRNVLGKVPMYYGIATVFDVSDTYIPEFLWMKNGFTKEELALNEKGDPIKSNKGEYKIINTPERQARFKEDLDLTIPEGDTAKMEILFSVLQKISNDKDVPMSVEHISDEGTKGFYQRPGVDVGGNGRIAISDKLMPTEKVAVSFHEITHSDMHLDIAKLSAEMGEKVDRNMREVQAEAVAFMTASHFGIDTATSSFNYLAGWSKGKELKELEVSLDMIFRESKALMKLIEKELDARGLDIRLEPKELTPLSVEEITAKAKTNMDFVLTTTNTYDCIQKDIAEDLKEIDNNEEKDIVTEQCLLVKDIKINLGEIAKLNEELLKAEVRLDQNEICSRIAALVTRVEQAQSKFNDLSLVRIEVVDANRNNLKKHFDKDPAAVIEELKSNFDSMKNLTDRDKSYLAKSVYISREYGNLLRDNPEVFVRKAINQLEQAKSVSSKNGTFIEILNCESWGGNEIFAKGTVAHPKAANKIFEEAEMKIRSMKLEAQKNGDYYPFNKCGFIVYTPNDKDGYYAFRTQIDIGDGFQKNLVEHMEQACANGSDKAKVLDNLKAAVKERVKVIEKVLTPKAETQEQITAATEPEPERVTLYVGEWKSEIDNSRVDHGEGTEAPDRDNEISQSESERG